MSDDKTATTEQQSNSKQTTDAGLRAKLPTIHWGHFLTGRDDRTIGRVTVLSKPAEWHALMIGALAILAPEVLAQVPGVPPGLVGAVGPGFAATYVLGRSTKDLARAASESSNLHIRDAVAEPAYVGAGIVLGTGVQTLLATLSQVA